MVEPVTIGIQGIAAGGEGVGHLPDGRVVFVHRTAPGDEATVRLTDSRRSWARGELLALKRSAADRCEPQCQYYSTCGGCTLAHLNYDAQLMAKAVIVRDVLQRIGGQDVDVPEVVPSPARLRYRNRASFRLARVGAGKVIAGFHQLGKPGRLVDIDGGCLLLEAPLGNVWRSLREAWGMDAALLPAGKRLRLNLRASERGQVGLLVEDGASDGAADELIGKVPGLSGIWRRDRAGGEPVLLAGRSSIQERWGADSLEVSGGVFLQVNRRAAQLLEADVIGRAGELEGRKVLDAYCGIGLLARRYARDGADVVGIDIDGLAIAEAQRAAPEARFVTGPVEEHIDDLLPADLVVLNPPRKGLARPIIQSLLANRPPRLIYVSCNPATLARDLSLLASGYSLVGLRSFDLFPQTAHVETVAELICNTDGY